MKERAAFAEWVTCGSKSNSPVLQTLATSMIIESNLLEADRRQDNSAICTKLNQILINDGKY